MPGARLLLGGVGGRVRESLLCSSGSCDSREPCFMNPGAPHEGVQTMPHAGRLMPHCSPHLVSGFSTSSSQRHERRFSFRAPPLRPASPRSRALRSRVPACPRTSRGAPATRGHRSPRGSRPPRGLGMGCACPLPRPAVPSSAPITRMRALGAETGCGVAAVGSGRYRWRRGKSAAPRAVAMVLATSVLSRRPASDSAPGPIAPEGVVTPVWPKVVQPQPARALMR